MRKRPRKSSADAVEAEVRKIYAELARRPIERHCAHRAECCQFLLTGQTPYLTKGEALVAWKAWRATGRKELPERDDGKCPMLDTTTLRCRIYESRPFACRTHYCAAAGGPYQRKEVIDLIRRLEEIDVRLGGDGARKLSAALAMAD